MLGERSQFEEGVIFRGDLGLGRCFDRHQRPPHGLIDDMALVRYPVLSHRWPVFIEDGIGVGARLLFEERTL